MTVTEPAYVELQVTSNFTFLRGASHGEELAHTAAALGHPAAAITDRNTLAGVVRAHLGCRDAGIPLIVGARLDPEDAPSLLCFPTDRAAYARLSRLLTLGKRRAEKGQCQLFHNDVVAHGDGQIFIALPPEEPPSTLTLPHKGGGNPISDESPPPMMGGGREGGDKQTKKPHPEPVDGEPVEGRANIDFESHLRRLGQTFPGRCYLAAQHLYRGDDTKRLARLAALAERCGTPLVATNDVHAHCPERRPLQDVLTCIREHCTIDDAGYRLAANAERHLKPAAEMARLFRDYPDAVARTVEIAGRCQFRLDELRYEYAADPVPEGRTPDEELARLAWAGAEERYPDGITDKVRGAIDHELELIAELQYAPYFLTVHDIVHYARSQDILCQGRGSAANSVVCYCLGITAIDPIRLNLLFERFVSAERNEPPDIDVDFEHERREEVIQYIYRKYGRERAGIAATVISYRTRSAIREVGKAMGLSADTVGALAGQIWGWSSDGMDPEIVRDIGLDPNDPRLAMTLQRTAELIGFPRHLSQHVGGFIITRGRLDELVPIANAAMEDRTVIEWDKDDLDAMGILKIDVLGLGMLTCIRKGFELLAGHHGRSLDLATVPPEDPAVYDMLCRADSLGVFQVESRAQMAFLPRMRPRNFYDLVIEVAIVRPGPIQGDMVHPYLRRRNGEEEVNFPSKALEEVLGKTLGVPLFQEQAMKIAIVAAGFTPTESDGLRRAMATFRRVGTIQNFREKLINGMVERGYEEEFAARCFRQIEGFGEYGFPESHAASFALLVYVSSWLKCHYPEVFACALLNSQPMGFYAPAQIVRDARDHGVEIRPVDVNHSNWDCTLEPRTPHPNPPPQGGREQPNSFQALPLDGGGLGGGAPPPQNPLPPSGGGLGWGGATKRGNFALRLGFRQVKGCKEDDAQRLVDHRNGGYTTAQEIWRRAHVGAAALDVLARADAFQSLGLDRRGAIWAVKALDESPLPLLTDPNLRREQQVQLPLELPGETVANDFSSIRMSLRHHPLQLLRGHMDKRRAVLSKSLVTMPPDRIVTIAGLVLVRQRPGTAKGVIFLTLEDETGVANIIVWADAFERYRKVILGSRLLVVRGLLQREGIVTHVIAHHFDDASPLLDALALGEEIPTHANRPDPRAEAPRSLWRHPRNNHLKFKSRNFH